MNKLKVPKILKKAGAILSKKSPEILTGLGIAGMITTTVLAVKATPKALDLIAEAEDKKGEYLTKKEIIVTTWKNYIPAGVTSAVSIACLIGASSVNARRNAALYSAYELSRTALSEYKDKVVEVIGEEKENEVKEKISEDRIQKKPICENRVISTSNGDELFYDPLSGRYFKSNVEYINSVVNKLNKDMIQDMFGYISLNEFYTELGLETVELGEDLGWNVNLSLINIEFHSKVTDDGKPCIVLYYVDAPVYNYSKA